MKKIITLILVIVVSNAAISQTTTLSPQMVNTAGGSGVVAGTYYDYTVGEPITLFGGTSCDSIFSGFQHCAIDTLRTNKATITVGGATNFCLGGSVVLSAPAGSSWLWSNSASTQTISATISGNYKVRTTNSCGDTIGSNIITVTTINPPTPDICMVSVDSATQYQYNIIYWDKTLYPSADSIIIYRETSTSVYTRIGSTSKDSLSRFIDTARNIGGPNGGHPDYGSYKYKIQVRDNCGNYGLKSPYHTTVFFQDQHNGNFNWNLYTVESASVTPVGNFYLVRDDANTNNYLQISSYSGTSTLATDPQYATYQLVANWRIDATGFNCTPTMLLGNNNTQGAVVKSRSNVRNNRATNISKLNSSEIKIYPNPSNKEVTISLPGNCTNCKIEFVNTLGETLKSVSATNIVNKIDISEFANGVYFVKVTSNGNSVLQKLVVQH